MDKEDIKRVMAESKEYEIITEKAIRKILNMTFEDWGAGIITKDNDKIKIHSETAVAETKTFNIDSFLSRLTKEQTVYCKVKGC